MTHQARAQRVDVSLDVVFSAHEAHFFAKAGNLSETGLFVVTKKVFPAGTPLHIVFGSPPKLPRISSDGIVRWAKELEGLGVELTLLSTADRQALQNFLNSGPSQKAIAAKTQPATTGR